MARASGSFRFEKDRMKRAIDILGLKTDAYIGAVIDYSAAACEKAMKENAPWTDRTGNARNGLRAVTEHVPGVLHAIHLMHSVTYGIWLEVRWSGRFAIILPTLREQGPLIIKRVQGLFARLGAGGVQV